MHTEESLHSAFHYEIFYSLLLITEKNVAQFTYAFCLSVYESQCDSEENVQCVPTSFDDNHLSQDSHNNPATSQQVTASTFSVCAFSLLSVLFYVAKWFNNTKTNKNRLKMKNKNVKENKAKVCVLFNLFIEENNAFPDDDLDVDVSCFR